MARFNSQHTLLNAVGDPTTATLNVSKVDGWNVTVTPSGATGAVTITISGTVAATSTGTYVVINATTTAGDLAAYNVSSTNANWTYIKVASSAHGTTGVLVTALANLVANRENI
jgi:hypothetical protein